MVPNRDLLQRLEAAIAEGVKRMDGLRTERDGLLEQNASLVGEIRELRERLADRARAAGNSEEGRKTRRLERRRREVKGRVSELLRLADRLLEQEQPSGQPSLEGEL